MKKRKIAKAAVAVLSIMTIGAGLTALTACDGCNDDHVHSYGDWTIVGTKPTLDEGGLAERYCEADDGGVEKKDLPKLTDTTFWTEGTGVDPSCTTDGERTFSSEYGTVTVTVPKDPTAHVGGSWSITKDPTATEGGKATHNCEGSVDIPALSDTTVWKENTDEYVPATHLTDGKRVYNSVYGKVTVVLPADENAHTYGDWSFVDGKKPTLEDAGEIQRICDGNKEHIDKKPVPALHDTDFWTYDIIQAPNHQQGGSAKYTNAEYKLEVEIDLPKIAHSFGKWTITEEPTADTEGEATRTCTLAGCASDETATETFTLPVLTNEQFWTKSDFVADYNHGAGSTYTNETYGSVTVYTSAKLVAPYDNKTYYSIDLELKDGSVTIHDSWRDKALRVDENSIGYGMGYPFNGKFVLEMVDAETGLVKVTSYDSDSSSDSGYKDTANTPYYAYVDFETGIFVLQAYHSWSRVTVAIPSDVAVSRDDYARSACAGDLIISYKGTNILVTPERTYFGVSIKDIGNETVDIENILNSQMSVVIRDRDGKVIKAYAQNVENEWVVADEVIGVYNNGNGIIITVKGAGVLNAYLDGNNVTGAYNIVSDNVIGAILDGVYYEFTLSGDGLTPNSGICEVAIQKVTLTYDLNGETITNEIDLESEISMFVPITLAVPEHETKQFVGWYTDAACTIPVTLTDGKYIPAEDVTLYAKWAVRVEIPLHGLLEADADKATLVIGEGEVISEKLTSLYKQFDLNENGTKYFDGWYVDAQYERGLAKAAPAKLSDNLQLYAKWVDVHALYGEYSGRQLRDLELNAEIKIDVSGNIVGTIESSNTLKPVVTVIEGKISSYDPATQIVTWVPKSDNTKSYTLWFDKVSGLLVIPESLSENEMNQIPYLLSKNGNIGNFESLAYATITPVQNKTKIVAYEGNKLVLLTGDRIYSDVVISDAIGNELILDTVKQSKTLVVTQNDTVVLAIGTTADKFGSGGTIGVLDNFYGTYTKADSDSLGFNGMGSFIWGDKSGTYAENGDNFELYVIVEGKETEYWQITLGDNKTYTAVQPMATISIQLVAPQGVTLPDSFDAITDQNVNIDIFLNNENALPDGTLKNTAFAFKGFYSDEACTQKIDGAFIPKKESVTIYAKYANPAVLTVVYNNGEQDKSETCPVGEAVTIERPVYAGHAFVGWFTKDGTDNDWGEKWENGSVIDEDLTLYAKWETAPLFNDEYFYTDIYNYDEDQSGVSKKTNMYAISFDPYGKAPSAGYPLNDGEVTVAYVEGSDTKLTITSGKRVFNAVIDPDTGMIVMARNYGLDTQIDKIYLFNNKETVSIYDKLSSSFWNYGKNRVIEYKYDNDTVYRIYIADGEVYFGVTFKDAEGNDIECKEAYHSSFYVKNAANEVIAKFIYDGEKMNELDGYEDISYTGESGNLTVNGVATITLDGVEGTYTLNKAEGATYTADAYIGDSYYEVTLDKAAETYTIVKRMVNVTFETEFDGDNAASGAYNKNIAIELPVLSDETHIFRGWFIDDETQLLSGEYIPTANVTLTAKWDIKVTLTVVYGNGLDTVVLEYGVGDTAAPVEPTLTAGQVFNYWYISDDNGLTEKEVYTVGEITENTKIYCKWQDAVAQYGEYVGFETWGGTASGGTAYGGSSKATLSVAPDGVVTVGSSVKGTIQDYNTETGAFKVVKGSTTYTCSYDADNGIIAGLYNSGTTLNNDLYIFFIGATEATASGSYASYWNSGYTRLLQVTVTGWKQDTINVFIYNDKVYGNVTWTSTDGDVAAKDAYKANQLSVFDAEGQLIVEFAKKGSAGLVELDGTQGTYTGTLGNIILDGVGGLTLNGESVDFTIVDDNMHFVAGNAMRIIKLGDGTYTQVQDGFAGNYTLPDSTTITLDGLGGAGENATYVIKGDKISIFTEGNEAKYKIDVSTKTLTEVISPFEIESKGPYEYNSQFFTYNSDNDSWDSDKDGYGSSYIKITIKSSGTLTFNWRANDDISGYGYSVSAMKYRIFDSAGSEVGSSKKLSGKVESSKDLDKCQENTASIEVTGGTTIYVYFERDTEICGSNACARIYNIELN